MERWSALSIWEKGTKSLWNLNPLWPASSHSAVGSVSHDVMAKTAFSVAAFLYHLHLVGRKKRQRDFAVLRIAGNERRDVAVDGGLTNRFTDVRITAARHPFAIELHLQFVVTEREHAKVIPSGFVDAVDLGGSDGLRPLCLSRVEVAENSQAQNANRNQD